jgi:predicted XRE-type DNA-binding protein
MAIRLEDLIAKLPEAEIKAIREQAATLIKQEATLRQIREKISARSQTEIATRLKIKQSSVSKLERRTDMYVKTLAKLIRAMGGELEIVARFPNADPVRITQFRDLTKVPPSS